MFLIRFFTGLQFAAMLVASWSMITPMVITSRHHPDKSNWFFDFVRDHQLLGLIILIGIGIGITFLFNRLLVLIFIKKSEPATES